MKTTAKIMARFALGLPLNGEAKTNATAFRRADKVTHHSGRAGRWAHLPHAHRAGYRLGALSIAVAGTYGEITDPFLTDVAAGGASLSGAAYGAYRAHRAAKAWNRRRTVIRPLAKALAPIVELTPGQVDARLEVPSTVDQPGDFVKVPLPDHTNGRVALMADVTRIVSQRIGGEWDTSWQLKTSPFYIHFTPKPAPPGLVTWADVVDAVKRTTQGKPVLGLGTRSEIVHLDFNGEIAHLAGSIATGGGKSSFLRSLVAQFSYHGVDEFHVFDTKMVSLAGMEAIPGMNIYTKIPDIWDGIAYMRAEMDRRYEVLSKNPKATFPRIVGIFEEQNAYAIESSIYHKQNRKPGDKSNIPPVWNDFAMLMLKGRQAGLNLVGMYQYLLNVALGNNNALRGQYGLKLIGRHDPQAWDLLVGTKPRMQSSPIPGRVIAVMGGSHRVVQLPFVEAEDAVEFALSRPGGHPGVVSRHGEGATRPQVGDVTSRVTGPAEPTEPRYTLPEACRAGILPMTPDTARQARHRDRRKPAGEQAFPTGIPNQGGEETYTAGELRYWLETRAVGTSQ